MRRRLTNEPPQEPHQHLSLTRTCRTTNHTMRPQLRHANRHELSILNSHTQRHHKIIHRHHRRPRIHRLLQAGLRRNHLLLRNRRLHPTRLIPRIRIPITPPQLDRPPRNTKTHPQRDLPHQRSTPIKHKHRQPRLEVGAPPNRPDHFHDPAPQFNPTRHIPRTKPHHDTNHRQQHARDTNLPPTHPVPEKPLPHKHRHPTRNPSNRIKHRQPQQHAPRHHPPQRKRISNPTRQPQTRINTHPQHLPSKTSSTKPKGRVTIHGPLPCPASHSFTSRAAPSTTPRVPRRPLNPGR